MIDLSPSESAKQKKRLIDRVAKKMVDYFEIEKLFYIDRNTDLKNHHHRRPTPKPEIEGQNVGCSSLEDIQSYFFDVYSSDKKSFNMSINELENLIEYLVTRYPKDEQIENRTRFHKCRRKKCFQSGDISKLINSQYFDYETFADICPVLLFNFEIGHCEYNHNTEGLSGGQSKKKIALKIYFILPFFSLGVWSSFIRGSNHMVMEWSNCIDYNWQKNLQETFNLYD